MDYPEILPRRNTRLEVDERKWGEMVDGGVEPTRLATLLEEAAARLGVEVRYERFDRDSLGIAARGAVRGGLCQIKGRTVILLDERLDAPDRVAVLARALAKLDLESVFLPPIVRATIVAHASGTPSRPRPLAKTRRGPT
jgi:hypothetical protein